MTLTDTDELPDHVLEDQAAAEGLGPRPTRRHRDIPHDADAEEAVIGAMLYSLDACDAAIEAGLTPDHFYGPRYARTMAAIVACLDHAEKPDPITVAARSGGTIDARDLIVALVGTPTAANAAAYARRIITCHRLRHTMAAGTQVAELARTGDLDGALAAMQRLAADQPDGDTGTTWSTIDLAAVIDGDGPPEPTMLARDDGHQLLYAGRVHAFNAESESGKSWLACTAAAERIAEGEHVLYLDFEDHATGIVGRLRALGVDPAAIIDRLHYIRPDDPIDAVATAALERTLIDHRPTLAIIDGVTEVMVQNGWSINDNDDTARFLLALPRRISRHGVAVVMIDHVPKDKESRGRYGIGAQHKLAGVDGAVYRLEVTKPFGVGRTGTSVITVAKDRPGHVRGFATGGEKVATMQLVSLPGGDVHLSLLTPDDATSGELRVRPTSLMEKVCDAIAALNESGVKPTRNGVLADVAGKKKFVAEALRLLIAEGFVATEPGPNRSQLHAVIKPYRPTTEPVDNYPDEEF